MAKELPAPLDYEAMEQKLRWLLDLEYNGFNKVTIVNNLERLDLPRLFYEFCRKYDILPHDAVSTIVSDFILRYHHGNNMYEQGILNRIKEANISQKAKKAILKTILKG